MYNEYKIRSTFKATYRKFIGFLQFKNIAFMYRPFQCWALSLRDKSGTSKKYLLRFIDSMYKLVTWYLKIISPFNLFSILQGDNHIEYNTLAYKCVKRLL